MYPKYNKKVKKFEPMVFALILLAITFKTKKYSKMFDDNIMI